MALPWSFSECSSFPGTENHHLQAESCPPKIRERLGPFLPHGHEVPETVYLLLPRERLQQAKGHGTHRHEIPRIVDSSRLGLGRLISTSRLVVRPICDKSICEIIMLKGFNY